MQVCVNLKLTNSQMGSKLVVRGVQMAGISQREAKGLTRYCCLCAITGNTHSEQIEIPIVRVQSFLYKLHLIDDC